MLTKIKSLVKDEEGATMVEYALMLALIAAICIGAVTLIGSKSLQTFTKVEQEMIPAATTQ